MQAVIRTPTFLIDSRNAGLSEDEQLMIVTTIARAPLAGDLMPGTGGCRKLRFPVAAGANAAVTGRPLLCGR